VVTGRKKQAVNLTPGGENALVYPALVATIRFFRRRAFRAATDIERSMNRLGRQIVALASTIALCSCATDSTAGNSVEPADERGPLALDGRWVGTTSELVLNLTLRRDPRTNDVSGSGSIRVRGQVDSLVIEGLSFIAETFDAAGVRRLCLVNLYFRSQFNSLVNTPAFNGTCANGRIDGGISGRFTGGLVNQQVQLRKQ
jgi:hypothetical protein